MTSGKYKNKAYPLRINESTLDAIKAIAERNNISANKQIEHILDDYVKAERNLTLLDTLRNNVVITEKLIPAGTGMKRYTNTKPEENESTP